jgi:hypothetical protein
MARYFQARAASVFTSGSPARFKPPLLIRQREIIGNRNES